jgi:hypothetical protein
MDPISSLERLIDWNSTDVESQEPHQGNRGFSCSRNLAFDQLRGIAGQFNATKE